MCNKVKKYLVRYKQVLCFGTLMTQSHFAHLLILSPLFLQNWFPSSAVLLDHFMINWSLTNLRSNFLVSLQCSSVLSPFPLRSNVTHKLSVPPKSIAQQKIGFRVGSLVSSFRSGIFVHLCKRAHSLRNACLFKPLFLARLLYYILPNSLQCTMYFCCWWERSNFLGACCNSRSCN